VTAPGVREVLAQVKGEGNPTLQLAPLKSVPKTLPPAWQRLLKRSDAPEAVFDLLWRPAAALLPRTIRAFRVSTTALGLLQTKTRPPSLVYFVCHRRRELRVSRLRSRTTRPFRGLPAPQGISRVLPGA
jgi:hypothetical protein